MQTLRNTLVGLALAALAAGAHATSYVMISDEALVRQAQLIVRVEIVGQQRDATASGLPATRYSARVEKLLKGSLTTTTLDFRVIGGAAPNGKTSRISGAPQFAAGNHVLLFLARTNDGVWGPLHLALGAFHEVGLGGRQVALRDLAGMDDASGRAPEVEKVRDTTGFERWIGERAAGRVASADYLVAMPASTGPNLRPQFTYIWNPPVRWYEFDSGIAVRWRAHENGEPAVPGHGFNELQVAINAWNADPDTNIKYQYDGTTNAHGGLTNDDFDNLNEVLFEDPNGEIPGSFDCDSGGVLAYGGPWFDGDTHQNPIPIQGADVVTQDGTECYFSSSNKLEEVLAHELGHTLGLGHSCGDRSSGFICLGAKNDALMRASAHRDGRGARLGSDDRAAILSLYGPGGGGGGGKPAAPSGLATSELTTSSVRLTWVDNASNETSYRVESKTAGNFTEVATLNSNTVTTVIANLSAGTTYSFRVRARNNAGPSAFSGTVTVTTGSATPTVPAKLLATPISSSQIQLTWQDKSINETGFGIEVESPSSPGFQSIGSVVAANLTTFTVSGLDPGTPYTFHLRALGTPANSAFSNEANATTASAAVGPCVPAADALCLSGNRFRVKAQWRKATGEHGLGTAVPYANGDLTGSFWFFDSSNIELLVKVLDGTASTNHFWVFYGALSDVQYWITVEDTQLGHSATYHNPQGSFCGNADVLALPTTGPGLGHLIELPAVAPGGFVAEHGPVIITNCIQDATTLCLLGRFQAKVSFKSGGVPGQGQALPLPGDTTGMFWFFNVANIELAVKAIDARGLNGKYWIFYGALSDVEYDLTVTDTTTGVAKTYHNAHGNLCGKGDTAAFNP